MAKAPVTQDTPELSVDSTAHPDPDPVIQDPPAGNADGEAVIAALDDYINDSTRLEMQIGAEALAKFAESQVA